MTFSRNEHLSAPRGSTACGRECSFLDQSNGQHELDTRSVELNVYAFTDIKQCFLDPISAKEHLISRQNA